MPISQAAIDKLWGLLFGLTVAVVGPGCMFVAAAYLTPALVGPPVEGSRHGAAKVVEFVALFGGLFIGLYFAMRIIGFLTQRYVETAIQVRWEQEFQQSIAPMPAPLRRFMQLLNRLARP